MFVEIIVNIPHNDKLSCKTNINNINEICEKVLFTNYTIKPSQICARCIDDFVNNNKIRIYTESSHNEICIMNHGYYELHMNKLDHSLYKYQILRSTKLFKKCVTIGINNYLSTAMIILADWYYHNNKISDAVYYYDMAFTNGHHIAMIKLCEKYTHIMKNEKDLARKNRYYKRSIQCLNKITARTPCSSEIKCNAYFGRAKLYWYMKHNLSGLFYVIKMAIHLSDNEQKTKQIINTYFEYDLNDAIPTQLFFDVGRKYDVVLSVMKLYKKYSANVDLIEKFIKEPSFKFTTCFDCSSYAPCIDIREQSTCGYCIYFPFYPR